jgi:hypothetical protein
MCELNKMKQDMTKIVMPVDSFIKEHKHLINVLNTGTKEQCAREADKQKEELKRVMGRPGVKAHMMMDRDRRMKHYMESPLMHNYD